MQIIIVQAEIEAAIRAHIEQQVSIKPGMEITIDLRSTRGDAGFTANIDIVPASQQPKATATPRALTSSHPGVVTKSADTSNQGKQEQPPVDNAHVEQGAEQFTQEQLAGSTDSGPSTVSTGETNTADAGDSAGAEPSSTEPAAEQPAEEAPAKPAGRSLFPNLKRISNA